MAATAIDGSVKLPDMAGKLSKTKSLSPNVERSVRALVQSIVDREFDGVASRAARAFGVSQAYVSDALNQRRGMGLKLVRGVARYTGLSVDDVLSGGRSYTGEPERYPTRGQAIRLVAQDLGLEESAVEAAADAVAVDLAAEDDPGFGWWFDQIRSQIARAKARTVRVQVVDAEFD